MGLGVLGYFYVFDNPSLWPIKILLSLFSVVPFGMLTYNFALLESNKVGLNFSDLTQGSYSPQFSFIMMAVDLVLYAFLAWYLSNIFPGEYGTSKPFYFLFQKSFWFPPQENAEKLPLLQRQEPLGSGIEVQSLSKTYQKNFFCKSSSDVIALDELSLNIEKNQIFGLLGHNGAGKSTTIGILTGLFPPSSGKAFVNGLSIKTQMDQIRESLGVCPQQDILFQDLTVEEHLILFSKLKGETECQIERRMQEVGLDLKEKTTLAKQLSGGMMRKLSVAIAFTGNPSIVFLDEPTAGIDVLSRKTIWSLLQSKKKNTTIILTTHYMEEAQSLSDRIAIIKKGNVVAYGNQLELKRKFGAGYYLTMTLGEKADHNEIINFISDFLNDIKVLNKTNEQMKIEIPYNLVSVFSSFFPKLDDSLPKLGIKGYGLSMTTLEQIFLKITEENDYEDQTSPSLLN
eukprot:TRINITY_DN17556_c0_g1_i1.p1 TRINITY_DN17556_c0_g1~~TRINITY_DN17556_c0_g1_i1.p1  ORF type:complete len:456 (-),score=137.87 TRINITY_DN17556_c0_g1_i1:63-1430(-)